MSAQWLAGARMADSTKAMRKSIVGRGILPTFQNRRLDEITADDLRALCVKAGRRTGFRSDLKILISRYVLLRRFALTSRQTASFND
ncbi:hypothetical protein [Paraburkholderia lacunae]|uniref:hypothetical protein n=1 Tax=Paraburkholderia lacunae TaxID=2211104 RepID=UPI003CC6040E